MDRQDLNQFIQSLDIEHLNVEQEYKYDEPSNILILQPKNPLDVTIESVHGFMSFLVEEFHFDAIHQILYLVFDGFEIFSTPLRQIKQIIYSEADIEAVIYEKNLSAAYEAMYGVEYGFY